MRPIYLKVAGLNSFRERQEIDFEQLCQGGVFGIFGPTGSGKSSILDAITLALFGKVERASNNTTGILNHAEDRLSVSFTFELRNASGAKRYTVERSYKRSDDIRLRSTACRLIEVNDDEVVLADKDREVTAMVESILGLTADDFTRAVVLPQGKFAEFITLAGSARRSMLQRLFSLEKYGDRLTARIKDRKEHADIAIKELVAEQAGLGDCSPEQMKQAHERMEATAANATQKRTLLIAMEKAYVEKKEVWHKQQERQQAEKELSELRDQEEKILELEQRLASAKQAERLQPYLEQLLRTEEEEGRWRKQSEVSQLQFKQAQATYDEKQMAYNEAREKRSNAEPQLVLQIDSLQKATELQQRITHVQQEQASHQASLEQIRADQETKKVELERIGQLLEKAKQRQTALKAEVVQKAIKAEDRIQISQAVQVKQQMDLLNKELQQINGELEKRDESFRSYEKQARLVQDSMQQQQIALLMEIDRIVLLDDQVDKLTTALQQVEAKGTQLWNEEKSRQAELERQRLAHQLVEQLREGEPCPLCGSTHHPNPIHMELGVLDNAILSELEAEMAQIRDHLQACKQLKYQLEHISKRLEQLSDVDQNLRDEIATSSERSYTKIVAEHLIPVVPDTQPAHERAELQQIVVEAAQYCQSLNQLTGEIQHSDRLIQKLLIEMNALTQKQSEAQVRLTTAQQLLQDTKAKAEQVNNEIAKLITEWKSRFPSLEPETIAQLSEQLEQRTQELEDLQERIDKSVTFIEEQETTYKQLDSYLREFHLQQVKLESELQSKTELIAEQQAQLVQLTGGREVAPLLQALTQQLEQVRQLEEQSRIAFGEADQLLRQHESQYKAAQQAAENAQERLQLALREWEKQLTESSFIDREAVLVASLGKVEQGEIQREIDRYRDALKAIEVRIASLNQLLQGKMVHEEEWERTQLDYEVAKNEDEAALQEKVRAQRDYEDLSLKHHRWQQLEQQRSEIAEQLERLQKLQSVCRGNAFVDFIAEEQLHQISRDASTRLRNLTRGRYSIEVDSNGAFIMSDDANGGVKRPVTTLSGGETFLTSLALALSLSTQVQLRGQYPLEFFFLDEGFGTLDQELLDTVVTALEKLHSDSLSVGVISHVPELKERLIRKIIVEPAEAAGRGSRVKMEIM